MINEYEVETLDIFQQEVAYCGMLYHLIIRH